jgi:hypothetical protein
MARPAIDYPLRPEFLEGLEHAHQLLVQVIDATLWSDTWIPQPSVPLAPPQILIALKHNADGSRGVDPMESEQLLACCRLVGPPDPFPTSMAEAAQVVRRRLVEIFDHSVREHLRVPGGHFAFEPHPERMNRPGYRGNVPVTGDYRSGIDAK